MWVLPGNHVAVSHSDHKQYSVGFAEDGRVFVIFGKSFKVLPFRVDLFIMSGGARKKTPYWDEFDENMNRSSENDDEQQQQEQEASSERNPRRERDEDEPQMSVEEFAALIQRVIEKEEKAEAARKAAAAAEEKAEKKKKKRRFKRLRRLFRRALKVRRTLP